MLAGYGGRTEEHDGVDSKLWTRALAIGENDPLVLVAVDIWVVYRIARGEGSEIGKVAWVVAILLLPIFAHIAWYLSGPGRPA